MEAIENMYYGIGQVALAVASADGKIDATEVRALEKRISELKTKANFDLDMIVNAFKLNSPNTDSNALLESGIHNFHLGDHHLTEEMANTFLIILNDIAEAKSSNLFAKDEVLISFMSYLRDRANMAAHRDRGYLNQVLVLVDLEETSENILARLPELENWLKSGFKITLLHCIAPETLAESNFPDEKERALLKLNALIDTYFEKKKLKGQIVAEVLHQRIEYLNQAYLDEHNFDFVIMPTKGKQPDDHYLTTKTSEHIQRHFANYLVVPDGVDISPLKNILVVTDYNFAPLDKFEPVLELCKTTNAKVTILRIGKHDKLSAIELEKKEALEAYLGKHLAEAIFKPMNDGVYEDVLTFISEHKFELLVALPLHTSFFQKFDGHVSVVKKLCQLTPIPLLVLNQHPKRLPMEEVIEKRLFNSLDF